MEYSRARVKLPPDLQRLNKTQFIKAIDEANLSVVDDAIARMYFLDQTPQADIAEEFGVIRLTITRRMHSISDRVASAASKIPQ